MTIAKLQLAKIIVFRLAYLHAGPPDSTGTPSPPITISASWAMRVTQGTDG
ncbi:MAG TPA: hypothetical protein VHZ98_12230 [Galbitalea sp.]|nr:hypothetical protein [Galbitalea sp.]